MGERQGNYHNFVHLANMNIKQEINCYTRMHAKYTIKANKNRPPKKKKEKKKE